MAQAFRPASPTPLAGRLRVLDNFPGQQPDTGTSASWGITCLSIVTVLQRDVVSQFDPPQSGVSLHPVCRAEYESPSWHKVQHLGLNLRYEFPLRGARQRMSNIQTAIDCDSIPILTLDPELVHPGRRLHGVKDVYSHFYNSIQHILDIAIAVQTYGDVALFPHVDNLLLIRVYGSSPNQLVTLGSKACLTLSTK